MPDLRPLLLGACLAATPLFAPLAMADDIEDSLTAALQAYKNGEIAVAKDEAEFAATLLRQKKADGLNTFLPEAMDGWTRELDDSDGAAAASFGGGLVSAAEYLNADQTQDVTLTITADSPMVGAMSAMFANASAMASLGTVKRIGKQRVVLTSDGEIQALVANRFLVSVAGSAPEDVKTKYFEAIDLGALAQY